MYRSVRPGANGVNIAAVDRTIRVLCAEIDRNDHDKKYWESLTEEDLLHEACVCMFSSQMVFEVAEASAQRLRDRTLLRTTRSRENSNEYFHRLCEALAEPVMVQRGGETRQLRPRFRNRLAALLSTTVATMLDHDQSLGKILLVSGSPQEARQLLVRWVSGFGPKQASLFLRRVGYSAQLAVLDTHILDYLQHVCGISAKPGALARLASYELMETQFQRVAAEFGHAVGCVDLAMWVTVRVAKQEAIW